MKKTLLALLFFPVLLAAQTQLGPDVAPEEQFEHSGWYTALSADGHTVIAGGQLTNNDGNYFSRARVHTYNGENWIQKGQSLEITDFYNNVYYTACRVALSSDGNIAAIGNIYTGTELNRGMVRVFKYVNDSWQQMGADFIGEEKDYLGNEISLSEDGNTIAMVAGGDDDYNDVGTYGHVAVYNYNGTTWQLKGQKIEGFLDLDNGFDYFTLMQGKVSLSNDGNTMVIGCVSTSGNTKIYQFNGTSWQLSAGLNVSQEGDVYSYGWDVSVSGNGPTVATSATGPELPGAVMVFEQVDGAWVQKGQTVVGELNYAQTGPFFGNAVSLSDDGNIMAVGAPFTDAPQFREGLAKVYVYNGSQWVQVGNSVVGEQSNDFFGYDVSVSADGNYVAMAAPFAHNNSYSESGVVKVFGVEDVMATNDFVPANFSVYPNPAQKIVHISFNESANLIKANIYNTLGQLVKTDKTADVDISTLAAGTYYIEAITNTGKATKMFIKE